METSNFSSGKVKLFQRKSQTFPAETSRFSSRMSMHFPGECGKWLTVFVRACWCRCWRRLPRYSMRAGRGSCLLARSRNLRIPHVISGRYSATRAQRTALTHTHTGLQGLHAVMVRGLYRREWALREACTCRTLSGPSLRDIAHAHTQ